jgi:hypothetical protein
MFPVFRLAIVGAQQRISISVDITILLIYPLY